ncbi:MAG TPA: bifunctional aldolase/short-chain dehydrogenase [Planctomycetota bacterium]|nr:bifunctional aldolase/short-chain dehydrogenase [Planctomycetota bacterium]
MHSLWNDDEARDHCDRYAAHGEAIALRVYSSRLIGRDPDLVLHGGGNTSVKTTMPDLLGREHAVMCVKGSGSDLQSVEPAGLPAVRLAPLRELRQLDRLDDEAMVNAVRGALLDCRSPNPSVEALLHAFLPHTFVDHTHADAILVLTDQPDPAAHVHAAFGDDVVLLPWIMPGFPLAKAVAQAYERAPHCRGIVLAKHGLFTFGDEARQSYERTIELVDRAEHHVSRRIGGKPAMMCGEPAPLPAAERRRVMIEALPGLRGALAIAADSPWGPVWRRVTAEARLGDPVASFAAHGAARALCETGPITPDHVIRTKGHYLFLSRDEAVNADLCRRAVANYAAVYHRYFESCVPAGTRMVDPTPVVAVIEGTGLVALHASRRAARIAADIAEHTLWVKAKAHALDRFVPLSDRELAEMEYWPLERNKLGAAVEPLLAGQVALVTGAAGAIGCGITEALLQNGACVFATDVDGDRLARVAERLAAHGAMLATAVADLVQPAAVEALFAECVATFGGVDCVVPNAGIAHTSRLEAMDPARFARVLDVNATATMLVLQQAAHVLRKQGTGGSIVVQASKNTFAPGAGFGAYSASKAAALQLARVAALEFAEFGVRCNVINADAVFGDDDVPSRLWQEVGPDRMQARGLDAGGLREYYRRRSLLGTTVLPRHVGEAVVFFAAMRTPTTGAVLPVDGGLPEAFPR